MTVKNLKKEEFKKIKKQIINRIFSGKRKPSNQRS